MKRASNYLILLLTLISTLVWLAVFSSKSETLRIIACDVGQGDAILIQYGSTQILTDGGPNASVLRCLERNIPFWDRKIELVILTHPQTDHFAGLISVFKSYKVDNFLANAVDSSTSDYQLLKSLVGGSGARIINPREGMRIRSGLIYLDMFNPTDLLLSSESTESYKNTLGAFTTKRDLNDFSILYTLKFKDFDALLTGDIGPKQTAEVISQNLLGDVEYLKVPHHGSKNGLTESLLQKVTPEVAVISVGQKNRYGHPAQEILSLLEEKNIKTFRTDLDGDVVVTSNGEITKYP